MYIRPQRLQRSGSVGWKQALTLVLHLGKNNVNDQCHEVMNDNEKIMVISERGAMSSSFLGARMVVHSEIR